eukprot:gene19392-biopygen22036
MVYLGGLVTPNPGVWKGRGEMRDGRVRVQGQQENASPQAPPQQKGWDEGNAAQRLPGTKHSRPADASRQFALSSFGLTLRT